MSIRSIHHLLRAASPPLPSSALRCCTQDLESNASTPASASTACCKRNVGHIDDHAVAGTHFRRHREHCDDERELSQQRRSIRRRERSDALTQRLVRCAPPRRAVAPQARPDSEGRSPSSASGVSSYPCPVAAAQCALSQFGPTPTSATSGTDSCATPAISARHLAPSPTRARLRAPRTPARRAPASPSSCAALLAVDRLLHRNHRQLDQVGRRALHRRIDRLALGGAARRGPLPPRISGS